MNVLLLLLPILAPNFSEAREPIKIEFLRQLDEHSSEGYRVTCATKENDSCEFVNLKNSRTSPSRKIEYTKAKALTDSFLSNSPDTGRTISSGPPTLVWDVARGETISKGVIPWARELSASRPNAATTRAVLDLEYSLMELAH